MSKRRLIRWVSVSCCSLLAPLAALGGDLNPPAGPVVETMKTLDEVEPRIPIHQVDVPFSITIPGSYYLAENLSFPLATSGLMISVDASDVTIDLNGFTIDGQDAEGDAFNVFGISVGFGQSDILIRNGAITRVTFGVSAQSSQRINVEDLCVRPIDIGTGILMSNNGTASDCEVIGGTLGFDMTVASNFVLLDCVVREVSDACYEFSFNNNGHVERCVAIGGVYGFRLDASADDLVFIDCVSNSNSIGFSDLSGQSNFFYRNIAVRNNIAYQNVANTSATPGTAGPWDNISQ